MPRALPQGFRSRRIAGARFAPIVVTDAVTDATSPMQQLKAAYHNFVEASEPEAKNHAGRDLIRAVFGKDSIAEDSIF